MDIKNNKQWLLKQHPYISVVTPVYNRRNTIRATIESVLAQTYDNYEYIIVDDGSTDTIDDIVQYYMDQEAIPIMYIKKTNGGVHTARNIAIKHARGVMYLCIDSDDLLFPNALDICVNSWNKIPDNNRGEYFEIKARCCDEKGNVLGPMFEKDINSKPWGYVKKYYEKITAEHIGFRVLSILKENPWPEPEGVKFVTEAVVWNNLRTKYKTWLINDVIRTYNTSGNDHISVAYNGKKKRTIQDRRNAIWNQSYFINHDDVFLKSIRMKVFGILNYCVIYHILKLLKDNWDIPKINNKKKFYKILRYFLWIPSYIGAKIYIREKM